MPSLWRKGRKLTKRPLYLFLSNPNAMDWRSPSIMNCEKQGHWGSWMHVPAWSAIILYDRLVCRSQENENQQPFRNRCMSCQCYRCFYNLFEHLTWRTSINLFKYVEVCLSWIVGYSISWNAISPKIHQPALGMTGQFGIPNGVFNGAIHLSTQNEICNAVELQVSVVHRSLVDHIHLVPSPIMVPYGTIIWYH